MDQRESLTLTLTLIKQAKVSAVDQRDREIQAERSAAFMRPFHDGSLSPMATYSSGASWSEMLGGEDWREHAKVLFQLFQEELTCTLTLTLPLTSRCSSSSLRRVVLSSKCVIGPKTALEREVTNTRMHGIVAILGGQVLVQSLDSVLWDALKMWIQSLGRHTRTKP